jgi:hypothetical protein
MKKKNIPDAVATIVGKALSSYYGSHNKLNNLFLDNGAPGEPPVGRNLVEKCEAWLKRANSDPTCNALELLGRILATFMEVDDLQQTDSQQQYWRLEINNILKKYGISYYQGGLIIEDISFTKQFPLGLPFGKNKPNFNLIPANRVQKCFFEEEPQIGVLKGENVYPSLSFPHLFKIVQNSEISGVPPEPKTLARNLWKMNQTDCEENFFVSYAQKYQMREKENVPVLIPQAWIQWHSRTKKDLRSQDSSYADDPYRLDFIAFWNNQRFAILVDDISHYAIREENGRWCADEKEYSKRLKEDRKLRKEGWQVFRVSNWEIRNGLIDDILADLKEFLGFEFPDS